MQPDYGKRLETQFMKTVKIGYDADSPVAYIIKENWKRVGKSYFTLLAKRLGFDSFNVWFSAGGPAVSGDIHLQGMRNGKGVHIFCNLSFVVIRSITKLGDYQGGPNSTIRFESLALDRIDQYVDWILGHGAEKRGVSD